MGEHEELIREYREKFRKHREKLERLHEQDKQGGWDDLLKVVETVGELLINLIGKKK